MRLQQLCHIVHDPTEDEPDIGVQLRNVPYKLRKLLPLRGAIDAL